MHKAIFAQINNSICKLSDEAYQDTLVIINAKEINDDIKDHCVAAHRNYVTLSTCLYFCGVKHGAYLSQLLANVSDFLKCQENISTQIKYDISFSTTVFISYLKNLDQWNSELPIIIYESIFLLEKILKKTPTTGDFFIPELADVGGIATILPGQTLNCLSENILNNSIGFYRFHVDDFRNNKNYYESIDKLSNLFLYLSSLSCNKSYRLVFFLAAHFFDLIGSNLLKPTTPVNDVIDDVSAILDQFDLEKHDNKIDKVIKNISFYILSCSSRSAAAKGLIQFIGYKPFDENDLQAIKSFTTKDDLDLLTTIFSGIYQNIELILEHKSNSLSGLNKLVQGKMKEIINVLKVVGAKTFYEPLLKYQNGTRVLDNNYFSKLSYLKGQLELFIEKPDLNLFEIAKIDVIDKEIDRKLSRCCLSDIKKVQRLINKVDQQKVSYEKMAEVPELLKVARISSIFLLDNKVSDILNSLEVFFRNFEIDFEIYPYPEYANDIADAITAVAIYLDNYSNDFAKDNQLIDFSIERLKRNNMFFPFGTTPDKAEIDSIDLHHVSMIDSMPHDEGAEVTAKYVDMILSKEEGIHAPRVVVNTADREKQNKSKNKPIYYAGAGLISILVLLGILYYFKI